MNTAKGLKSRPFYWPQLTSLISFDGIQTLYDRTHKKSSSFDLMITVVIDDCVCSFVRVCVCVCVSCLQCKIPSKSKLTTRTKHNNQHQFHVSTQSKQSVRVCVCVCMYMCVRVCMRVHKYVHKCMLMTNPKLIEREGHIHEFH